MYDLTNKELKSIIGGINITAAFINGVKGIVKYTKGTVK